MQQPTILFIPVSSTQGVGEYTRSLILAEEIKQQIPSADIHFVLNKNTSYGDKCPFTVHYSNHSATKDIPKVKEVLNSIKPNLVIFDCAGRSEQFAHAKSLGAQVIFISQHKKKRARGLKINRIFNTDIHWVVQPSYAIEPLSYYERLKLKLFSISPPKHIGPVLPKMVEANSEATLNEYQLVKDQYILFSAGSGGHIVNQQLAADIYYSAAKKYANECQSSKRLKCVMVFGENYPNELPKDEEVLCLRSLPSEKFISLLIDSKINVISAGDTLLQAINLHKPCVASAISKDQFSRLSACENEGLVCSSEASEIDLFLHIKYLLNREESQKIIKKMQAFPSTSGLDITITDIKNQLLINEQLNSKVLNKHYLFYISQNYSFEILRPLQRIILENGDSCAWFVEGDKVNLNNFYENETVFKSINHVKKYQPVAVFVPGNHVPNFIPGLKIQVFHGLEWKKKGHFGIRGFFDLYCTHGEQTTNRFNQLAKLHGYFHIKETGWPKLDPLFETPPYELDTKLPVVLFAPTFSPSLTCALECFYEIKRLADEKTYYWLVKFHPKMNQEWIELYKKIESDNFKVVEIDSCLPLLQRADVLVSDTSSIIGEFLLLDKLAVTYKNSQPAENLIDIDSPNRLEESIELALKGSKNLINKVKLENEKLHPYSDGKSSKRILEITEELINNPIILPKKKPVNFLRTIKLRKKLGYWKW